MSKRYNYKNKNNATSGTRFRSGYEEKVYNNAINKGRELDYEPSDATLRYVKPQRQARYIPDFVLPNGVIVETKGRLTAADRAKMLNVVKANPDADIRFLFQRSRQRITKSPNSLTYEEWAEKHGFRWSIGENIPEEWWDENNND